MKCNNCGSTEIQNAGALIRGKSLVKYNRYLCKECGHTGEYADGTENEGIDESAKQTKFIVTSALNNRGIDTKFLNCLERYADVIKAKLIVIPVRYIMNMEGEDIWYPEEIKKYIQSNNLEIEGAKCKILGGLRISATAENPLSGIDPMSKGKSLIIGHPQVQMKTLPVLEGDAPILWTTGTVSENIYSDTKLGYKAAFNHSMSAILVDFADGNLHIRNLNFDGTGFNDLEYRVTEKMIRKESVEVLVTGDEHAIFADHDVMNCTYLSEDSIVNSLKPKFIVRHDVLDSNSISHHDRNNFIAQYKKHINGSSSLSEELQKTLEYILKTTPEFSKNIIVSSNHNDHLTRWLNECDPKKDPENAILYHEIMYLVLNEIEKGREHIDPFQIWLEKNCDMDMIFTERESIKFFDIEVGLHGDRGSNGAKGTRASFSKLPEKCIIGHSHSPGWEKGCVQVGTSSKLDMSYTKGSPSSWRHCHCVIHKNGKRQVIFITNGKWR